MQIHQDFRGAHVHSPDNRNATQSTQSGSGNIAGRDDVNAAAGGSKQAVGKGASAPAIAAVATIIAALIGGAIALVVHFTKGAAP